MLCAEMWRNNHAITCHYLNPWLVLDAMSAFLSLTSMIEKFKVPVTTNTYATSNGQACYGIAPAAVKFAIFHNAI